MWTTLCLKSESKPGKRSLKGTTEDAMNFFHSECIKFKITTDLEYHPKKLKYHQWYIYHSLRTTIRLKQVHMVVTFTVTQAGHYKCA